MQSIRQQALMFILALVGLTALGLSVLLALRGHFHAKPAVKIEAKQIETPQVQPQPEIAPKVRKVVEASSLSTLAFLNRFNRLHKESDDLKKLVAGLKRTSHSITPPLPLENPQQDVKELEAQREKIAMAVARISQISDQSRQFIDKLNDLMGGMQTLATEGNIVALNVTIEMAKLQSQITGAPHNEKNGKISDQIRALATTAATITGKMAMILSQFRYVQEDFGKQAHELIEIKDTGSEALSHICAQLQNSTHSLSAFSDSRAELEKHLPVIDKKVEELESEIEQLQQFAKQEIESRRYEESGDKPFKVIAGGA